MTCRSRYQEGASAGTSLTFLSIDNIHVMRKSLSAMHELVRGLPPPPPGSGGGGGGAEGGQVSEPLHIIIGAPCSPPASGCRWCRYPRRLSHAVAQVIAAAEVIATGWLGHVGRVLAGAALMAHEVAVRQRTVGGP
eukprot:COSAG01_NODE_4621_length_4872_cov_3.265451_9_plen_135_part_01